MKILILDDERWRHDELDRAFPGHQIYHAYTYTRFCAEIAKCKFWDMVCFDHDLGTQKTGADAAKAFIKSRGMQVGLCVVHSWNPAGAVRIADTLRVNGQTVIQQVFGTTLLEQVLPAYGLIPILDTRRE